MDRNAAYADLREQIRAGIPYFDAGTMSRFHRIADGGYTLPARRGNQKRRLCGGPLEAASWCFLTTDIYKNAVLKAGNLGLRSLGRRTLGRILPAEWRKTPALSNGIAGLAGDMARTAALH